MPGGCEAVIPVLVAVLVVREIQARNARAGAARAQDELARALHDLDDAMERLRHARRLLKP